jgi:hypothetical protein
MKVLIATDCAAQGKYLEAGKVYELDSNVAIDLVRMGRAVDAPVEQIKPKTTRKARPDAVANIEK